MDFPLHFRCPISMELMKDPVTISTGVTYERKNIEKWFYTCKKKTCPATMQVIHSFDMTPNHTLKRLILAWQNGKSQSNSNTSPAFSIKHDELVSLLNTIESTPFKGECRGKILHRFDIPEDHKIRLPMEVVMEDQGIEFFKSFDELCLMKSVARQVLVHYKMGFIEHGLGIAAITKKMLNISNIGTKIGVKILSLICNSHPTDKVLEDMLTYGAGKVGGFVTYWWLFNNKGKSCQDFKVAW
ncbi:hypothetical protein HAX54_006082 [Datura stramonium]|uniref:U-box domain-containing protein n=1 Tax=Datura stramonium TaxID=4076 RepID=A0ABS8TAI9_DATST|nr:hypothetical protein [Datura stramonium]